MFSTVNSAEQQVNIFYSELKFYIDLISFVPETPVLRRYTKMALKSEHFNLTGNSLRQNTVRILICAGILEQSMWARNRDGKGLSYRPARLYMLAESIPWNRCLGSLKV
jgi:hypothetical protein